MTKAHTITTKHALLLNALAAADMHFIVEAGKYEHDGTENCKYSSHVHATFDEALADLATVSDYPWHRVRIHNAEFADLRMEKLRRQAAGAARTAPRPQPAQFDDYYAYVAACRKHAKAAGISVVSYATHEQFIAAHGAA